MSEWQEFSRSTPKSLPVILLCDVSGSMGVQGKIQALNQAVRELIGSLANESSQEVEIQLAIITFGGWGAVEHTPLQPAAQVTWHDMVASGGTPMGAAMSLAAALVEDKDRIPSRAYRPAVVLVTDGIPTDDWETGLRRLTQEGRARKADRFAMAIGADANEAMLEAFLGDPDKKVFHAEDSQKIHNFFKYVGMSVSQRSRSDNPNAPSPIGSPHDIDNF